MFLNVFKGEVKMSKDEYEAISFIAEMLAKVSYTDLTEEEENKLYDIHIEFKQKGEEIQND